MKKLFTLIAFTVISVGAFAQTYTQTTIVTGLDYCVAFDVAPDGRFFCTQKGDGGTPAGAGTATIEVFNSNGVFLSSFYDLSDSVNSDFERGLLGITLDPAFSTNQYVYVYYNHRYNGDERIRIVRFTDVNNLGTNPTIIFDLDVANNIAGNHVGGNLHFRPTDPTHIYFTIGDLAYQLSNPTLNYANKLTNPYGKVLRISSTPGGPIPTDNPFYDDGNPLATNCDWIWSYGHRNPFDFCFSPTNDSLYISENGQNTWDEMNLGRKGGFYGWANCEGFYNSGSTTTLCTTPDIDPLEDWATPLPAVTGILFYSSTVMPEFDNHVLVADNDYGRVYDITLGNAPAYDTFVSRVQWMDMTTSGGLTTIKQGADGCVYAMKGGYVTNGAGSIYRVCPQGLGTPEFDNSGFYIKQNSPNPFNTTSNVTFKMTETARATVTLYDVFGRQVAVLVDGMQVAGEHTLTIDAVELGLTAGMYFCTMQVGQQSQSVNIVVSE